MADNTYEALGEWSENLDPEDLKSLTNLVTTLSQNVSRNSGTMQKSMDSFVKALLDNSGRVQAARKSVDVATIRAVSEMIQSAVKIQQSMVAQDSDALRAAKIAAYASPGANNSSSPEFRKVYTQTLIQQLGGAGPGQLNTYGTLVAAFKDMGLDANNQHDWSTFLDVARSIGEPAMLDAAVSLQADFELRSSQYASASDLVASSSQMHDLLTSTTDEAAQRWVREHGTVFTQFLDTAGDFDKIVLPALQNTEDGLHMAVQANINPSLKRQTEADYQAYQTILQHLPGSKTKESPEDALKRKMALFVRSPQGQRLADKYGMKLGEVIPLTDAEAKAALSEYPSGVFLPGIGIYIQGPEDQKAVRLAYDEIRRVNDPRGSLLRRAVTKTEDKDQFANISIPRNYKGGELKQGGISEDGNTVLLYRSEGGVNRYYVTNKKGGKWSIAREVSEQEALAIPRKFTETGEIVGEDTPIRDLPPEIQAVVGEAALSPDRIEGARIIQPNFNDPMGYRGKYQSTVDGEWHDIPPDAEVEVVGGGGERRTLRKVYGAAQAQADRLKGAQYEKRGEGSETQMPETLEEREKSKPLPSTVVPTVPVSAVEGVPEKAPGIPLKDRTEEEKASSSNEVTPDTTKFLMSPLDNIQDPWVYEYDASTDTFRVVSSSDPMQQSGVGKEYKKGSNAYNILKDNLASGMMRVEPMPYAKQPSGISDANTTEALKPIPEEYAPGQRADIVGPESIISDISDRAPAPADLRPDAEDARNKLLRGWRKKKVEHGVPPQVAPVGGVVQIGTFHEPESQIVPKVYTRGSKGGPLEIVKPPAKEETPDTPKAPYDTKLGPGVSGTLNPPGAVPMAPPPEQTGSSDIKKNMFAKLVKGPTISSPGGSPGNSQGVTPQEPLTFNKAKYA